MSWEAVGRFFHGTDWQDSYFHSEVFFLFYNRIFSFGVFFPFFLFYNPFLIPFLERRFQKWKSFLCSKKVGHSQLSLAGAKGELVAGCGGQQAGGDFAGTVF